MIASGTMHYQKYVVGVVSKVLNDKKRNFCSGLEILNTLEDPTKIMRDI